MCACGWDTSYHYAPLGAVSGDYCDLIEHDGSLFFFLGDVSGKGISASLLMTQIHTLFRNFLTMGIPLEPGRRSRQPLHLRKDSDRTLRNHRLRPSETQRRGGNLQRRSSTRHRHNRDNVLLLESTGVPLGLFHEATPPAAKVQLDAGDTIFLYTDGLSEACCQEDEYGVARLTELMGKHRRLSPTELVSVCLNDLAEFTGTTPRSDDLTLLALQRTAAA